VHNFTHDNWFSIEFDPFGFSVKDLITKNLILTSNSSSDLYPFSCFSKMNNNLALSTTISSVDLWHRRWRHPRNDSLSYLLSKFHLPCTNKGWVPSICEACHKGKACSFSFSKFSKYYLFSLSIGSL
jgi:hypothetical protein